jgi:hypothetical protein
MTSPQDRLPPEGASSTERNQTMPGPRFAALNYESIEQARAKQKPRTPIRVYELYPQGLGGFSVKTVDYHGTKMSVAATSVRQAYAVAHKGAWIDPGHNYPIGIVSVYDRDRGTTLWCGCSGHRVMGGQVRHGAGIRALRAAIDAHHCDEQAQP